MVRGALAQVGEIHQIGQSPLVRGERKEGGRCTGKGQRVKNRTRHTREVRPFFLGCAGASSVGEIRPDSTVCVWVGGCVSMGA